MIYLLVVGVYVFAFAFGWRAARRGRYTLPEIDRAVFDVTGAGVQQIARINAILRSDTPTYGRRE